MVQQRNLSVIIPFYNEAVTISKVLDQVRRQSMISEIILVNDGSSDESAQVVKEYIKKSSTTPNLLLVSYTQNRGKGHAIIQGIKRAKSKWIIIQDADLEYNPKEYPKLLRPLLEEKADLIIGNRWESKKQGYLLAQFGNWAVTFATNLLFGTRLHDSYSCYKITSRKIWRQLGLTSKGFEIEAEIVAKAAQMKLEIGECLISYNPRTFSEGKKIGVLDGIKGIRKLIQIRMLPRLDKD